MARIRLNLDRVGRSNGPDGDGPDGDGSGGGGALAGQWGDCRLGLAEQIDVLRRRAAFLSGPNGAILKMYLENGSTFAEIARVAGVSETTVARRIRRCTRRLIEGRFPGCVRQGDSLSRIESAIARDAFLEGLSQRRIAVKRGMSIYQVRKILGKIRLAIDSDL